MTRLAPRCPCCSTPLTARENFDAANRLINAARRRYFAKLRADLALNLFPSPDGRVGDLAGNIWHPDTARVERRGEGA